MELKNKSIITGASRGIRAAADGHSAFRNPGNYDPDTALEAVAGMHLALATGRGEGLATDRPGLPAPLVEDRT